MQRLRNSWALTKASWAVLMADKELLLFPAVSFFASLIVLATFMVPMILSGMVDQLTSVPYLGTLVMFLFYVVLYTVTIFCNAAIVGAAHIRLKGGDPTIRDGFRIAFEHLGSVLSYAVISATVGMVLQSISERSGALGRIVISLLGAGWSIVTFLVVPVLVIEGVGPVEAIKRSFSLLKTTWGEQIAGNLGMGFVFGLVYGAVILLGTLLLVLAIASSSVALIITAASLMGLSLVMVGLIQGTMQGIYTTAVYQYATTGNAGEFFDPEMVKHAFKQK